MSSRYAIIENNIVTNIVICSADEAKQNGWVLAKDAFIGDTYENKTFIRNNGFKDWESVRQMRNSILEATDWIVVSSLEKNIDVPENWKSYRQELRDITDTYSSLEDVIFPNPPN
jgi:hypothetical protein